jgi:hypothetical protein
MTTYVDGEIEALNSTITTNDTNMTTYVDGEIEALNSTITTNDTNMTTYVDGEIEALKSTITTNDTNMTTYVDGDIEALNSTITTNDTNMTTYVDGEIEALKSTITTNDTNMTTYVDKEFVDLKADNNTFTGNNNFHKLTSITNAGFGPYLRTQQYFIGEFTVFIESDFGINQLIILSSPTRSDAQTVEMNLPAYTGIELPNPNNCQGQKLNIYHQSNRTLEITMTGNSSFLGKKSGTNYDWFLMMW